MEIELSSCEFKAAERRDVTMYQMEGGLCHHLEGGYVIIHPRLGASALHNKTSAEHRGLAGIFKAKKAGWHTLH